MVLKDKDSNGTAIAKVTAEAKKRGHDVRIRDIAYAILRLGLEDDFMAYSVVFGTPGDNDVERQNSLRSTQFLVDYFHYKDGEEKKEDAPVELVEAIVSRKKETEDTDITFEENKAAMVELIQRTEDALAENRIETDKALKIIADLRVKLNDKFAVADKTDEQYIVVTQKYNSVCPYTHKECWEMTKEFAMKKFNLIEKK